MQKKAELLDRESIERATVRMAHQIIEKNHGTQDVVFVGIRRRGVPLANILKENIEKIESANIPIGELDITFYRDDLSFKTEGEPNVEKPNFGFDVNGKIVVLVDDVIYTGRTARAAIEAVFSLGRPAQIQLAVLIDRGHRELPIRPDYVGKNIPTSKSEIVKVMLDSVDGSTGVVLYEN